MEIWKDIEGYEGVYQVSNFGQVRSLVNNLKLRPNTLKDGYCNVKLSKKGKQKSYRVHRLVAKAFIPNPSNYEVVNHKNGNITDNKYTNLEWCTQKQNVLHAISNNAESYKRTGETNGISKLTLSQVEEIRNSDLSGNKLSKIYQVNKSTISRIRNNELWPTQQTMPQGTEAGIKEAAKEAISVPAQQGEELNKATLEGIGFTFHEIGHNDFDLAGTFCDNNGIEVNWYTDNTYGIPYGTEGNVMELKSFRDLVLLRMLLTGEAYSEPEYITALKEAVNRKLAAQPLQPSLEEKKEDLVASDNNNSIVPCDAPFINNKSIEQ